MKNIVKKFFKSIPGKTIILAIILVGIGFLVYEFHYKNIFKFQENEQLFIEGVKEYLERNPSKMPSNDSFLEVSLMDMYKMEYVDSLYVPGKNRVCSEDGFVRVVNKGGETTYLVSLTCGKYKSNIDSTAPNINLKGNSQIVIHLGDNYEELGIESVKDNKDKLKIEDVEIDNSRLDLTKTGTYKIVYSVYDSTYNKGIVEREVIVADTLSGKIEREHGANYIYKGRTEDNYVLFSGMLFRIVRVNNDHTTVLITDNNIANLSYTTYDLSYLGSNVYTWLNEYFYESISDTSKKYMVDSTWCYDTQDSIYAANNCNNKIDSKVGLLTLNEYFATFEGEYSYLLTATEFMLLNWQDEDSIWATSLEDLASVSPNENDLLTGIRPVIVLRDDICITSGTGTYESPYKLQDYSYGHENDLLSSRLIGEYVYYSGYAFRISNILKDGKVELTQSAYLKNQTTGNSIQITYSENMNTKPNVSEEGNFYYQLNNDIMNHISEEKLVKNTYEIPKIDASKQYKQLEKDKINAYLSIPASYEMFAGTSREHGTPLYYLSDYEDNVVSFINGSNGLGFQLNKTSYASKAIKLKLTLKEDLKILSGKGTVTSPYYVK